MSVLNTQSIPLIPATVAAKRDPYLLTFPAPSVPTPAKTVWWIGQVLALASVNVFGVGIMLIALHFSELLSLEVTMPDLGSTGMGMLPYSTAGVFAGLFYRKWAKQVMKPANVNGQVRAAVIGAGPALGIFAVTYLLCWATIFIVAVLASR